MNDQKMYLNPETGSEYPLAGRMWRLMAIIIDGIIAIIVGLPLLYYFNIWSYVSQHIPVPFSISLSLSAYGLASFVVINFWLLERKGQTLGKWCVDIAIVGKNNERKTALQIVIYRILPVWLLNLIPIIGLIDSLFIFRSDRRCVHDLIASTKVVNVES